MEEIRPAAPPSGAAGASRWNGWHVAGVVLIGVAALYIVQVVLGLFVVAWVVWPAIQSQHLNIADAQQLVFKSFTAPVLFLLSVSSESLMAFIAIGLATSSLGATRDQLGIGRQFRLSDLLVGILAGIALVVAGSLVGKAQEDMFGPHPQAAVQLIMSHHGIGSFVLDFFSVAMVAGICEEIMFRGVLFTALAQRMSIWPAAIISGIVFGLAHADLWSLAALATVGIGLALLYSRTRSLWPNMVAHTTFNAFSLVLIFWFPQYAK